MAGVPTTFRGKGENIISSYNYTDIASGTGYVSFYPYNHQVTTVIHNGMSIVTASGNPPYNVATTNGTDANFAKYGDWDFDVAFTRPQKMKGKVRANFTVGIGTPGSRSGQFYCIMKLRKWDGTTETELSSVTTKTTTHALNDTVEYIDFTVEFDMSATTTTFGVGDSLRITQELWSKSSSAGFAAIDCFALNDPAGRIDSNTIPLPSTSVAPATSRFLLNVPFKLDI